jgi:RNA polymerase sigma-70 factor (ECF subfamily)
MMDDGHDFAALLAQVRAGQQEAAAEFVRRYEPQIRRVIRVRLTDPALRRQMDSVDICQSVMGQFFVRASLGEFDLQEPPQLVALLAKMARNRVLKHFEKQHAARRDIRRLDGGDFQEMALANSDRSPLSLVAAEELLQEARRRMSAEERQIVEQRALGRSWEEIASELSSRPDAVRMRYRRTLDRLAAELAPESC